MNLIETLKAAKESSLQVQSLDNAMRNKALLAISLAVTTRKEEILRANKTDLEEARKNQVSAALLDRLELSPSRIDDLAATAKAIAEQADVAGELVDEFTRDDGLIIARQRVPLGVIAMIFESRPNVVIDCACLAIKSGNCILLKGGKEAKHSNRILAEIITDAYHSILPEYSVVLVESHSDVSQILEARDYVDVVIPRGGEGLIKFVYENAKIPVIAHFKGNCHVYLHGDADPEMAKSIVLNSKLQRPGVCNAMESLLVHVDFPVKALKSIFEELLRQGCEIRADKKFIKSTNMKLSAVSEADFAEEYLDKCMSAKQVSSLTEATEHINKYGSKHTEAILCATEESARQFRAGVDASCVIHNASTRFNDGGELGLGAELGIATTKFHAYGPMGAKEMTSLRFVIKGQGQIRN